MLTMSSLSRAVAKDTPFTILGRSLLITITIAFLTLWSIRFCITYLGAGALHPLLLLYLIINVFATVTSVVQVCITLLLIVSTMAERLVRPNQGLAVEAQTFVQEGDLLLKQIKARQNGTAFWLVRQWCRFGYPALATICIFALVTR
jgi:hypothetical protein